MASLDGSVGWIGPAGRKLMITAVVIELAHN